MKTGTEIIAEERQRQKQIEGWTTEHDADHDNDELAQAAAVYAIPADKRWKGGQSITDIYWPFDWKWFKPDETGSVEGRIKELAKAGALMAAEIDRLQALPVINHH